MVQALLYCPEPASAALAARSVAGRSLAVRALVGCLRAGVDLIAIPEALRDRAVERALDRMPALRRAVRWVEPAAPAPGPGGSWLLLPAAALVEARTLSALLAAPGRPAVLKESAEEAPAALVPGDLVTRHWAALAAAAPVGPALRLDLDAAGATPLPAAGLLLPVREEADLGRAEDVLYRSLVTSLDGRVDQFLNRRCSQHLTRVLVRTPVTPNQVSLASLALGAGAIWCFWPATPLSALWGILLYALASILDHCDGEVARLTFQESPVGAHLDWAIDTVIHAGLVLGMAVTAGGPLATAAGIAGAFGVTLSAWLARSLPHEIEIGPTLGGVLRNMGNRDLFYLLIVAFATVRWLVPPLVAAFPVVVALGAQGYWIACLGRIRRSRRAGRG